MPRSGKGGNLPLQELTSKLSSDELVKRLKVRSGLVGHANVVGGCMVFN